MPTAHAETGIVRVLLFRGLGCLSLAGLPGQGLIAGIGVTR
jgi:hypothetical protein